MSVDLQQQIDDINQKLSYLEQSSAIPFNTEAAFRERLGMKTLSATSGVVHNSLGTLTASGIVSTDFDSSTLDTDGTLAANSDTRIATQKAVKTYVDASAIEVLGDGSDGNVTVSVDTTLTRDMFYNNLTVNSGVTLNTGSFRVFAKTSATINGKLSRDGNDGSAGVNGLTGSSSGGTAGTGGAGGAALATGSLPGSPAGKTGSTGGVGSTGSTNDGTGASNGTNTTDLAYIIGTTTAAVGHLGGKGGDATTTGGTAGTLGTAGTFTASTNPPRNVISAITCVDTQGVAQYNVSATSLGSTGGGGGSGTNTVSNFGGPGGGGGGAGSNGGVAFLFSKTITIGAAGSITANGGNGGNGGVGGDGLCANPSSSTGAGSGGGGAGGNAGNGGVIILGYKTLVNNGSLSVSGGTKGTGATGGVYCGLSGGSNLQGQTGANGTDGHVGTIYQIQL